MKSAQVFPNTWFQNPRARRLEKNTKIFSPREHISTLRDYVTAIDAAWGIMAR